MFTTVNIVEHLAAKEPDISFRIWWKAKQSYEQSEYWICIHQVARNTTPNNVAPCLQSHCLRTCLPSQLCWVIKCQCCMFTACSPAKKHIMQDWIIKLTKITTFFPQIVFVQRAGQTGWKLLWDNTWTGHCQCLKVERRKFFTKQV